MLRFTDPRLVGLLQAGRGTSEHLQTGRMDSTTHAQMFLAALARLAGPIATPSITWVEWTTTQSGP